MYNYQQKFHFLLYHIEVDREKIEVNRFRIRYLYLFFPNFVTH